MESQELTRKVLAHLEGSQNISFLNEYCHKNKVALPEWKPTGKPMHGNAPYLHGMQLNILGQRFEVEGAQSKNDAKKACAAAAITFFESKGLPGFVNRYHNYVALLFQLCQQIPISPPEYNFKVGASGTFIGECLVDDLRFEARLALILDENSHVRKSFAKDDVSCVAFKELSSKPLIANALFIGNPSFVTLMEPKGGVSVKKDRLSCGNTIGTKRTFNAISEDTAYPSIPSMSNSVKNLSVGDSGMNNFFNSVDFAPATPNNLPVQLNNSTLDPRIALQEVSTVNQIGNANPPIWAGVNYQNEFPLPSAPTNPEPENEEEDSISFVDLLWEYYESKPEIGKPFYNSRTIKEGDDIMYKSQLIVGPNIRISGTHRVKADSAEEVAREIFMEVHPNGKAIVEKLTSEKHKKKQMSSKAIESLNTFETNDIYYSDDEMAVPSYESLLRKLVDANNLLPPIYKYSKGDIGYTCTGTIYFPTLGREHSMTSLRQHSKASTAREDVCHDLFVLMKSLYK